MPEIVRIEILGPKLCEKELAYNDRAEATARIITMLGVNFVDEEDRKIASTEFRTFLREWRLTKDEVIEAYRMAITKQLQKQVFDSKTGLPVGTSAIQVFPNLSIIQAGEILNAYQEYKISNHEHTQGIEKLKELIKPKNNTEVSEEQKKAIRNDFLMLIFDDLNLKGYSSDVWQLWQTEINAGDLTCFAQKVNATITNQEKREIYEKELKFYMQQIKSEAESSRLQSAKWIVQNANDQIRKGLKINEVVKRCRCITGSNYLKGFLSDFETFKKAIEDDH